MSILSGELAETIGDALIDADIPFDVVVTRSTPGEGGEPWDPAPAVLTDYPCKGYVDTYSEAYLSGGLVESGDVKVVIIANTLAIEPSVGDSVTARAKTYYVLNVSADPALALYELQARA
jgi:hypothetical protein